MSKSINPLPQFFQMFLLRAYSITLKSGLLSTAFGNKLFEISYHLYKNWLEAKAVDRLQPWVHNSSTVIDVGANAGFFTRRFARWIGDDGFVMAIEPESKNIERLERFLSKEDVRDRVRIFQAVAAEEAGTLMLAINPVHPGDHRISEAGQPVEAVTLDGIVADQGWPDVSLIKVDVQGAEVRVLDGAREVLRRCRPALFLEIDPVALGEQNSSVAELVIRLRDASYFAYALNQHKEFEFLPLDEISAMVKKHGHYIDILCLPEESTL
ncbi:MAG: FkbM family methyltransferase [Acidiferrobacteraceae bacterium]|nr:FkbM family methyltransferase [Acidiferrobacteraceae bacterium]